MCSLIPRWLAPVKSAAVFQGAFCRGLAPTEHLSCCCCRCCLLTGVQEIHQQPGTALFIAGTSTPASEHGCRSSRDAPGALPFIACLMGPAAGGFHRWPRLAAVLRLWCPQDHPPPLWSSGWGENKKKKHTRTSQGFMFDVYVLLLFIIVACGLSLGRFSLDRASKVGWVN